MKHMNMKARVSICALAAGLALQARRTRKA